MTSQDYLARLGRLLASLGAADRDEFLREMGSHIEELRERQPELAEDEIVAGLTPPEDLARELLGVEGGKAAEGAPGSRFREALRVLAEFEARGVGHPGQRPPHPPHPPHPPRQPEQPRAPRPPRSPRLDEDATEGDGDEELFEREFPMDDIEVIAVRLLATDLRVEASSDGILRVRAEGRGAARRLEISQEGGKLSLIEHEARGPALDELCLELPPDIGFAEIASVSGEILIEGVEAQVSVKGSSGDISLSECPGHCAIETASGTVEADSVGAISVKTASGDIRIGVVAGDAVARSASGDISLEEIEGAAAAESANGDISIIGAGGKVGAKSSSGDIHIVDCAEPLMVTTGSGSVEIDCSAGCGGANVSSLSGDISLSLDEEADAVVRASSTSGEVSVGERGNGRGEIRLGAGGPEINLKTVSGDISVDW
jgi:hypothetical protein